MSELSDVIDELVSAHSDSECDLDFGPSPSGSVPRIEAEFGVTLPKSFKSYLEEYAGGMMFGYEIFGVPTEASKTTPDSDTSAIVDIVKANERMRSHFPAGHIFICSDGGDFQFFLDAAELSNEVECPVLMYGPGAEGLRVADSFADFLTRIAEQHSFVTE